MKSPELAKPPFERIIDNLRRDLICITIYFSFLYQSPQHALSREYSTYSVKLSWASLLTRSIPPFLPGCAPRLLIPCSSKSFKTRVARPRVSVTLFNRILSIILLQVFLHAINSNNGRSSNESIRIGCRTGAQQNKK